MIVKAFVFVIKMSHNYHIICFVKYITCMRCALVIAKKMRYYPHRKIITGKILWPEIQY